MDTTIGNMNDQVPSFHDSRGSGKTQRRLVVMIGPPKTATTSLQLFLSTYANRKSHRRAAAFKDWSYPKFMNHKNGLQFLPTSNVNDENYKKIRWEFKRQPESMNIVVASEYLLPRIFQLQRFANWTNVRMPEVVINSRSKRMSQVFSVWKHYTVKPESPTYNFSFHQYICSKEAEDKIGRFTDPLSASQDLVHGYGLRTIFMDMAGVDQQGLDICHAFSCSILNVDCNDGNKWVRGIGKHVVTAHVKKRDPDITNSQMQQMERVFHQRDCAYGSDLYKDPLFSILYQHNESWPIDCIENKVNAVPAYRYNRSVMFEELRSIMKCPGYDEIDPMQKVTLPLQGVVPMELAPILAFVFVVNGMRMYLRRSRGKRHVKRIM